MWTAGRWTNDRRTPDGPIGRFDFLFLPSVARDRLPGTGSPQAGGADSVSVSLNGTQLIALRALSAQSLASGRTWREWQSDSGHPKSRKPS